MSNNRLAQEVVVERWELSESPTSVVGSTFGPLQEIVNELEGLAVTADNEILVADGGEFPVRLFDQGGHFKNNVVARGDGPGESTQPQFLGVSDKGTAVVFDRSRQDLKEFSLVGKVVSTRPFEVESLPSRPNPAVLTGGHVLALTSSGEPTFEEGTSARNVELWLIDPEEKEVDATKLTEVTGRRSHMKIDAGRPLVSPWLFEQPPQMAVDRAGFIATAPGNANEISILDLDGNLLASVVLNVPRLPVTESDRERYVRSVLEDISDPAQRAARAVFLESVPSAEHKPVIHRLVFSDEGLLWVGLAGDKSATTRSYWIYDRAGAQRATISIPRDEDLLAVKCETLWTLHRDELDVETIRSYRILGVDSNEFCMPVSQVE